MSFRIYVKNSDTGLAKKLMARVLTDYGPDIDLVIGPLGPLTPGYRETLTKPNLTPALVRTVNSVERLFRQYGREVSTIEIAKDLGVARNRASAYLKELYQESLIERIPNKKAGVKNPRYLFKPKVENNDIQ